MNFMGIFTAENQGVVYISFGGTDQCHGDTVGGALGPAGFQAVETIRDIFPVRSYFFYKGI